MKRIDPFGAFIDYPPVVVASASQGLLHRKTFGVKDIFDVAGYPTGCGHPLKRQQSGIAQRSASCVQAVLNAGAVFNGKTETDELAYSLNGENFHYGTPINPAAPDRIPGGSSSGSAVAVAGRLSDFAIGSDTGGSVRVPASYCGIWGMRPTHGVIPVDGAMPFAPSFDTVGWFAPDSLLLRDVGRCLLPPQDRPATRRLMIVQDAFALLSDGALAPLCTAVSRLRERLPAVEVTLASDGLESWATVFRIHQGYEIWESLGAWVTANHPLFGPGIKERFAWASTISKDEFEGAQRSRAEIRRRILDVVGDDGVLILPTAPDIAPARATPSSELETFRNKALQLLCIAGLAGTPQINIPGESSSGCPIGLSISGSTGSDFALLDFCTTELP